MARERSYRFGRFTLEAGHTLTADGNRLNLAPKAVDLLLVLIENQGQVVEKDRLLEAVWPGVFVEENNLAVHISQLRKALTEVDPEESFIETVPRRGYRFLPEVTPLNGNAPALSAEPVKPRIKQQIKQWAWIVPVLIAILGIAAAAWIWTGRRAPAPTSVAVLPFQSLNAQDLDLTFGLGLADAVIARLARARNTVVLATSAVRKYTAGDPIAAGRELKVDAVLAGSMQRSGDRMRLVVQLLRVRDGKQLWGETYDHAFGELFALEDALASRVAGELRLELGGPEGGVLPQRYVQNAELYSLYLKGRFHFLQLNRKSMEEALKYYSFILEKDPRYTPALVGVGQVRFVQSTRSWARPADAEPAVRDAVRAAAAIDDSLPEVHVLAACLRIFSDHDWPAGDKEMQRAFDLDPNNDEALEWSAFADVLRGRWAESVAKRKKKLERDPFSAILTLSVAWSYRDARQYDEALAWHRKALALDPGLAAVHSNLSYLYREMGRFDEGLAEDERTVELSGLARDEFVAAKDAFQHSGPAGYYRARLEFALARSKKEWVSPLSLARLNAELRQADQTIEYLTKGLEQRDPFLAYINVQPEFDFVRDDPRFRAIVKQLGL